MAQHLLLGDTVMMAPLLKKIRERFPNAELIMTCRPAYLRLFEQRPYGVSAMAFDPRDVSTFFALFRRRGFDLAILPGDNRFSWLARALDACWIVGFVGDGVRYKNWLMDEYRDFPSQSMTWGELVASQLLDGQAPAPFGAHEWLPPESDPFPLPEAPYCVLHLGARTLLRHWGPAKWRDLIHKFEERGIQPVITCGPGEQHIISEVDPQEKLKSYRGVLSLPQFWRLLSSAHLLICPDTGIAHLAKLTAVPTVVLFGPGSAVLFGSGDFWPQASFRAVTVPNFPCRDQNLIFGRYLPWAGHCARTSRQCSSARCMDAISADMVFDAAEEFLTSTILPS